jgi:hypothetical protein
MLYKSGYGGGGASRTAREPTDCARHTQKSAEFSEFPLFLRYTSSFPSTTFAGIKAGCALKYGRITAGPRYKQRPPELLEGKGQDAPADGAVVLIPLINWEGVLDWDFEMGGR